jgi:glycosyltransferase involved in cell wall biosynthesis
VALKFSVITVCRNAETTIERCLVSVRDQLGVDVQHIVVDGASTDKTVDICRSHLADLHDFISEPDKGIYDGMNKGISRVTGDVVCFLNADDHYSSSSALRLVKEVFDSNSSLEAVTANVSYFSAKDPTQTVRTYNSGRFRPSRLQIGLMPAHPATFFRKSVYDRHGEFKTDYRIAADFEFIARVFKDGKINYQYLPEVIVRMQTGGVSTRGLRSVWTLNREILRACHENDIQTNLVKLLAKGPLKLMEYARR